MASKRDLGVYDHHEQWLFKEAGITPDVIKENRLFSVNATTLKNMGFNSGSDAIVFPYYDLNGEPIASSIGEPQIERARLSEPYINKDDKPVRYVSRKGEGFDVYIPAGFKALWESLNYVVITEGEKKAIAGVMAGIPCLSIPGVWMWHDPAYKKSDSQEKIPVHHRPINPRFNQLLAGKHVIVLADSDAQSNESVMFAMQSFARALRMQVKDMSACHLRICSTTEDEKIGLDDWLMKAGTEAVLEVIHNWMNPEISRIWIEMPYRKIPYSEQEITSEGRDSTYIKPLHILLPDVVKSGPQQKVKMEEAVFNKETGQYNITKKTVEVPLVFLSEIMQIHRVNDLIVQENNPDFPTEEGHLYRGMKPSGIETSFKLTPDVAIVQARLQSLGVIFAGKKQFEEWVAINYHIALSHQCEIKQATRSKGWMRRQGEPWQYIWGSRCVSNLPKEKQLEVFSVSSSAAKASSGVQQKGSFEVWKEAFVALLHNPSFAVLAGFACSSLMLSRVRDMEPGIAHIYGDSSHGKSTTQRWLASLIGSTASADAEGAYAMSWRTTDNAAENIFYDKNDAMVLLDEMHLIPNNVDVYQVMYQIANGGGKKRSTIHSENKAAKSWKVQTISSGEISLETAQKARKPTKEALPGGLEFRVIQLNVGEIPFLEDLNNVNITKTWGRYEPIARQHSASFKQDSDNKTREIIASLDRCFMNNHGFAWELMANRLLDDAIMNEYVTSFTNYAQLLNDHLAEDASNILRRKSKHVSAAMTGLKLLMDSIGVEFDDEGMEIFKGAQEWAQGVFWTSGLIRLTGKEGDRIMEQVGTYLSANMGRFFIKEITDLSRSSNLLGVAEAETYLDGNGKIAVKNVLKIHIFNESIPEIAKNIGVDERRLANNLKQSGWKHHNILLDIGMRDIETRCYTMNMTDKSN